MSGGPSIGIPAPHAVIERAVAETGYALGSMDISPSTDSERGLVAGMLC